MALETQVETALATRDFVTAARLIEETYRLLYERGDLTTVQRWLEVLPDEVVRSRPELCIIYAGNIEQTRLDLAAMRSYLDAAEQALSQVADSPETRRLRGLVAAGRVNVAAWQGHTEEAESQLRLALDLLPEGHNRRQTATLRLGLAYLLSGDALAAEHTYLEVGQEIDLVAFASPSWGYVQQTRGHLRQAMGIFRGGIELARQTRPDLFKAASPSLGVAYLYMGMLLYEWNDLAAAEQSLLDSATAFRDEDGVSSVIEVYYWLALVYLAQGDGERAAEALGRWEQGPGRHQSPLPRHRRPGSVAGLRAHLRLIQGDLAAAGHWADNSGLTVDDTPAYAALNDYLTLARVRLAQGRADEALRLLSRLLRPAETQGRMGDWVIILALHTLALQALGNTGQATQTLQRALTLAEPEGYVRTFVDEGHPMHRLLALVGEETEGHLRSYVRTLLAALPRGNV